MKKTAPLIFLLVVSVLFILSCARTEKPVQTAGSKSAKSAAGPRLIPLEGCLNFRDLGGYTGEGGVKTRYDRIFRSDDLSKLSPADIDRISKLGISIVIDLRADQELSQAPNPLRDHPGFVYRHFPLLDGINSETGGPFLTQSLPEMYKSLLTDSGAQLGRIFRVLAEAGDRGVVFHCTAGKDRTGVVAALLLDLCGVAGQDIIADYALTYDLMRPHFDLMRERAQEAGFSIPEDLLRSDAVFMQEFLDFLKETYGGAEAYLLRQGLSPRELRDLKALLL
ncbi:MAG: tyrosine-protein phosphatase [Treponema sp.]|jgi:protein-tyrosine phosphatase|nr:tyrosine-protein phosphatase [Treponema sp.]